MKKLATLFSFVLLFNTFGVYQSEAQYAAGLFPCREAKKLFNSVPFNSPDVSDTDAKSHKLWVKARKEEASAQLQIILDNKKCFSPTEINNARKKLASIK